MSDSDDDGPSVDMLLLGCASTGKTLLMRHLDARAEGTALESSITKSTTGMDLVQVSGKRFSMSIREVGSPMLRMWHTYYGDCCGIVYMIDLTNTVQVAQSCIEFMNVLAHDKNVGIPTLLLLNKSDAASRMAASMVTSLLRFEDLKSSATQPLTLLETSAKTGAGLDAVEAWMTKTRAGHGKGGDEKK